MKWSDWFTWDWFTARYNPTTNRIEGCQYGSMLYYHESRHQEQYKNEQIKTLSHLANQLSFFGIYMYPLVLFLSHYSLGNYLVVPLLLFIPDIFINIYLEVDAVKYQIKMVKNRLTIN